MSQTTLLPSTVIGNMTGNVDPSHFIGLRDINNLTHALLHDTSVFIQNINSLMVTVRRPNDESFNPAQFKDTTNYPVLVTYHPEIKDLNFCNGQVIQYTTDVLFRIEAKENNKQILESIMLDTEVLLTKNLNSSNYWTYTYNHKKYNCSLQSQHQLLTQTAEYNQLTKYNFYYAKQTYFLQFGYIYI